MKVSSGYLSLGRGVGGRSRKFVYNLSLLGGGSEGDGDYSLNGIIIVWTNFTNGIW